MKAEDMKEESRYHPLITTPQLIPYKQNADKPIKGN